MAVIFDAVGPSSSGEYLSSSSNLSWSHTCTGSNLLLTVSVSVGGPTLATVNTSATYAGIGMMAAGKALANNQTDGYIQLFYLVNPPTGANTVSVTCNSTRSLVGGSISFTGVNQTNPISNVVTNAGHSTAPTITVTSNYGDMVVDGLCNGSNINSSNQQMEWRRNGNTLTSAGNGAQSYAAGKQSVTTTYSVANEWWGIVGMNVKAAPITNRPTLIATYSVSSYMTATSPKTVSVTTAAGDVLVVYGMAQSDASTLDTPSGNSVSFTLQQYVQAASYSPVYIWTGTDTTGGSNWTLTGSSPSGGNWGFTCLVFRGSGGVGVSAQAHATGEPSLGITTTRANSALVVCSADANFTNGAARTWLAVNGNTPTLANNLEINYQQSFAAYTIYGAFYYDTGAIGGTTVGLSAPTGQQYSIAAIEILSLPAATGTAATAWLNA